MSHAATLPALPDASDRAREHDDSLARGTDGAIMVIGVFMAIFLVGLLYYSVGIGESILFRERMQDASDAAAFSAAVMDARGMNIIALINIVMAAVLAILVALRAIQLLCIAGIALASALSWITGGASLAAIPPLTDVETTVSDLYSELQPTVDQILRACHRAEQVVQEGMPFVAEGKAVLLVMTSYDPPAQFGFVWPVATPLPTQFGPYSLLCNKAAHYATSLVMLPFDILHIPDVVKSWIEGAVEGVSEAAAATVCGGSSGPEHIDVDHTVPLPQSAEDVDCERQHTDAVCNDAQTADQRRQYDPNTGTCATGTPPGSVASDCNQRIQQAFAACNPSQSGLSAYVYQLTHRIMTIDFNPADVTAPPTVTYGLDPNAHPNPEVTSASDRPLCGQGGSISTDYRDPSAVCGPDTNQMATDNEADMRRLGILHRVVPYTDVTAVLGCKQDRPLNIPPPAMSPTPSEDKSPMVVKDGVQLGGEEFQIRGFVIGSHDFNHEDRGVRMAAHGRDPGFTGDLYRLGTQLGRLSFAQAEFYYSGSEAREEWLFNMFWRARLRRFRLPQGTGSSSISSACGASGSGGSACGATSGLQTDILNALLIH